MPRPPHDPDHDSIAGRTPTVLPTSDGLAGHRREASRPKLRRAIVCAIGVSLLAAIGFTVATREFRADPSAARIREDNRASRGDAQFEATPGPSGTSTVPATPSPSSSQSVTSSQSAPATTKPATANAAPTEPTMPTGQRTIRAFITGYSYFDNTPAGSVDISNPVIHQSAAGMGTYADPITVAVGHSIVNGRDILDWPTGTRFYIPNLRRYFIVEDTCGDGSSPQNGPCHSGYSAPATTWLDIWIGGKGGSTSGSDACMNAITDVWDVLVNPWPNYATAAGSVYGSAGCTKQYGNALLLS